MQLAAVLAALVAGTSAAAGSPFDGWEPHRYCNDLEGIGATRVPPLRADQAARVESLEQVQVLSRHGARAPYARLFCWDVKRHNPMNAEWSCTTTSVSSQNIDFPKSSKGYGRLYRKSYLDGLNILDGTCEIGGLLPLGRQQHLLNGEFLRDAYVGDGPLKIFSTTDLSDVALDEIYLRSDDEERTLGSGQAMVDGIFPPDDSVSSDLGRLLTWHVTDYATDYINSNERGCPMLGLISNISYGSNTFQEHMRQPETVALTDHFNKLVGNFSWSSVLECLSVSRCSGLALPDGVDEKTFTEVFHEVEVQQGLYYTNNDSQVSKFAMQPLAHEFVKRIDKVVDGAKDAPKLSITMAHDSTIMPFLAAVQREKWDRLWTPYAGMLIIELYKTKSLSFAARLIFHGEVLEIPECGDTLCDIEDFLKAFEFARQPRNCTLPKHDKNESAHLALTAPQESGVSLYLSIFLVVGLVVVVAGVAVRVIGGRKRRNQEELSLLP